MKPSNRAEATILRIANRQAGNAVSEKKNTVLDKLKFGIYYQQSWLMTAKYSKGRIAFDLCASLSPLNTAVLAITYAVS